MKAIRILLSIVILLSIAGICYAQESCASPTNGFWGLSDRLTPFGIEIALDLTTIYQTNVKGGGSTHRRKGRFTGSYDLELEADMQKLLSIEGGRFYTHAEGSYSDGIDGPSVGSFFGVNGDAAGNRAMDITEVWYEQSFSDGIWKVRVGKIDLTGGFECCGCPVSFDGNKYANDENTQFLNNALVNNPTIPFPDRGLGVIVQYNPVKWWYASAGIQDAHADARETGFHTTFRNDSDFFSIFETGITPQIDSVNGHLQGAYRFGLWYDPQPKANSDRSDEKQTDDVGFYTSCDQMLAKENNDTEDSQGLGTFFRYGFTNGSTNDMTDFYSFGLQYQGLFDGRDNDVVGLGYARGFFSNQAKTTYMDDYESVIELYYNAQLTPWFQLGPSLQYIANPGGSNTTKDVVVLGLRAHITF